MKKEKQMNKRKSEKVTEMKIKWEKAENKDKGREICVRPETYVNQNYDTKVVKELLSTNDRYA